MEKLHTWIIWHLIRELLLTSACVKEEVARAMGEESSGEQAARK
jgi:hypothetical protein